MSKLGPRFLFLSFLCLSGWTVYAQEKREPLGSIIFGHRPQIASAIQRMKIEESERRIKELKNKIAKTWEIVATLDNKKTIHLIFICEEFLYEFSCNNAFETAYIVRNSLQDGGSIDLTKIFPKKFYDQKNSHESHIVLFGLAQSAQFENMNYLLKN